MNESVFDPFPLLETKRLLLNNYNSADAKAIHDLRSRRQINQYLDRLPERSIEDTVKHIEMVKLSFFNKSGLNWVMIEKESKELIGYVGLWRIMKEHNRAEIGYVLKPEYWNNGFMTEAIQMVSQFAFKKLQLHSIEANVNPDNAASIKVLEKCHFRKEAYFRENYYFNGKYLDSVILCLLEKDLS